MLWRGNLGSMNVVARQLWSTKKGCKPTKQTRNLVIILKQFKLFFSPVFQCVNTLLSCVYDSISALISPWTRSQPHLAGVVVFHLPASGKLQLFVGKHVEEGHQVPVVLVALKMVSISTDLADHMFQTSVGGEHTVGTLRAKILRQREKQRRQS